MKNTFFQIFRHPYAYSNSVKGNIIRSILFGLFVFLFIAVFQPFGLASFNQDIYLYALGYGACTTFVMLVLNVLINRIFPFYFNEDSWTVGREVFWILLNIFFIGILNAVYTSYTGIWEFSTRQFLWFQFFTLVVALFPVTMLVLMRESGLKKQFHKSAEIMNGKLNSFNSFSHNNHSESRIEKDIVIKSTNSKDSISLNPEELIMLKSSDNYVEVLYIKDRQFFKSLVRNTLKNIQEDLSGNKQLFRCHKSYLVNLQKVIHVSGNAQGYKLHMKGSKILVPVSRTYNELLKSKLSVRP